MPQSTIIVVLFLFPILLGVVMIGIPDLAGIKSHFEQAAQLEAKIDLLLKDRPG